MRSKIEIEIISYKVQILDLLDKYTWSVVCPAYGMCWGKGGTEIIVGVANQWLFQP